MSTADGLSIETGSLTTLHWAAVLLAAVSGAIHLVLGVRFVPSGLGVSFLLAGLGFFGAIVLVLLAWRRRLLYAVGVPFTGIQIVLWYAFNYAGGGRSLAAVGPIEAVDKLAQAALIVLLVVLYRRAR